MSMLALLGFQSKLSFVTRSRGMSWMSLIDFELQAKRGDKFLCLTLFRNFQELFIPLQPHV